MHSPVNPVWHFHWVLFQGFLCVSSVLYQTVISFGGGEWRHVVRQSPHGVGRVWFGVGLPPFPGFAVYKYPRHGDVGWLCGPDKRVERPIKTPSPSTFCLITAETWVACKRLTASLLRAAHCHVHTLSPLSTDVASSPQQTPEA